MDYIKINYPKTLTLFLASLVAHGTYAKVISPQAALDRFKTVCVQGTRAELQDYELSYSAYAEDGDSPAYYAFTKNSDGGFIILPADDRFRPLLAYTDSGKFDYEKLPDDLKWFLQGYANEIKNALTKGFTDRRVTTDTKSDSRAAIEPLVKTKWDQGVATVSGDAYNKLCPRIGNKKCYTGCVPTAMAQIMNYHSFPKTHGTGSWEYKWTYDQNGTEQTRNLSYNFEETDFDWGNMLDDYTGDSTDAQKEAVARLMYACGVSLEASYGVNETGAFSFIIPDVLRTYFGYDSMVRYLQRDFFSNEEWEDIIYKEISEGRPVQYGGYTKGEGGHSFVCDGYDGNGLYHINWGWGGLSDGYFSLSALNPDDQGTGSYEGGYNYNQNAIVGIQPPTGDNQEFSLLYVIGDDDYDKSGSFELKSLPDIDGNMTFSFPNGWLVNNRLFSQTYHIGVKVVDSDGNIIGIMESISGELSLDGYKRGNMYMDWGDNQLIWDYSFKTSAELYYGLKEGTYSLIPVYKTSKMNWNQLYTDSTPHFATITIGNSGIEDIATDKMSIAVDGRNIIVKGLSSDIKVDIFNVSGETVGSQKMINGEANIELPDNGIYIFKCGANVRKVIVK